MSKLKLLLCCWFFLGNGCGDDKTGVPLPDPLPDVAKIRSSLGLADEVASYTLVGLPDAVAGEGTVIVKSSAGTFEGSATEQGTFYLKIKAEAEEQVSVRYERSEEVSVKLVIDDCVECRRYPPRAIDGVDPITAPVDGEVTIKGKVVLAPSEPSAIIAANVISGQVQSTTIDGSQAFELTIAAKTGDEIAVFEDFGSLGPRWTLTVP